MPTVTKYSHKNHERGALTRTLLVLLAKRPHSTRELADEIGHNLHATSTLLYLLLAQNRIIRVRAGTRGRYGALCAIWYAA